MTYFYYVFRCKTASWLFWQPNRLLIQPLPKQAWPHSPCFGFCSLGCLLRMWWLNSPTTFLCIPGERSFIQPDLASSGLHNMRVQHLCMNSTSMLSLLLWDNYRGTTWHWAMANTNSGPTINSKPQGCLVIRWSSRQSAMYSFVRR